MNLSEEEKYGVSSKRLSSMPKMQLTGPRETKNLRSLCELSSFLLFKGGVYMKLKFLKRLFRPNYPQHPDFENLVDEKSRQALMMMLVKF